MIVDYISDIHVDFHTPFHNNQLKWEVNTKRFIVDLINRSKNGEVICIAGDFSHFNRQSL